MGVLDNVEKKEIRDLLGKGWLTHDGMWFYHTCQEFGIEKANALNNAAIKSLAPIEMERAKRVLGIDKDRTRLEWISSAEGPKFAETARE